MGAIRSKFLPHAPQSLAAAALGRWAASPAPISRWRMHVLSRLIVTTMSVTLSAGCSSKMSVSTVGGIKKAATAAFKVTALSKIVTAPGEVLTLTGSGFRSTLSLAQISGLKLNDANGQSVTAQLAVQSGDKATVTLPASMNFGKYALTLTQDGESQQITLFSNGGKTDYPVFTAGSDKICIGEKFYDETGTLREGTKVCNLPLPDCSEDGAKACIATTAYSAAATNGLADKVVSGQTVAGIAGNLTLPDPTKVRVNNGPFGIAGTSLTPTLAECASDGGINCVAVASYPAAKLANFSNGDIRSGVTVAGVAGVLSGAPSNCASDGAVGCLSTTDYPSALKANLAPKVLAGNVVAGVAGSATPESHVNCTTDGATSCIAVSSYAAAATSGLASKVLSGTTVAGIPGNVTLPDATKVRVSNGTFGVAGTGSTPTLLDCSADGLSGCVAVDGFKSADMTKAITSNILTGTTIAGISGSVTSSPAACAADGGISCVANESYTAAATSGLAAKVVSGNTVAGTPGSATAESHNDCAADGATNCVAVTNFPAVDKLTKLVAGNIKKDVAIAGVTGDYPSSTHPLTGADSTTDLPIFTSVNGGNTYQWFKADGTRLSGIVEANASVTPGTTSQVLNAGLYRQVTVVGDANLIAGNIKKDSTIFTVTGSVIPTAPPCLIDGGTDCVASSTFAAAATVNLADKVLSGATVAAIAGNVTLPDASKVLSTTPYGVAGTSLTGTLALPDPAKVRVSNGNFGIGGNTSAPTLADCSADGLAGCVTVDGYKSADMTKAISVNILTGTTIAGISGSVIASPAACAADGGTNCVANAAYTAAATTNLANKVLSGNTVAAVAGNVTLPIVGNVYTGIQYGVAGTGNTGTLTIPSAGNVRSDNGTFGVGGTSVLPTLADCSADGDVGCVAVGPYYAAAVTTGLAPKIVSGNTVAGIAGSATAESHSDCAADGATGCITVSTYKAADMTQVVAGNIKSSVTIAGVVGAYPSVTYPLPSASATTDLASLAATTAAGSYEWWGSDGARYTGAITDAGTITPTTSNQTFNTSLYRQFTVVGDANLVASKIKSSVSIFGVTGDYPSATNPLAGADSTADLDLATFDAKIKSATNFEWFSSAGTRYQNAGDADITAANIANGVTIFGATGTLSGVGTIDPWNVRTGVTIGGVAGKLPVNCRNQGSSAAYTMGTPQLVSVVNVSSNQLTVTSHGYTANQMVRVNYTSAPSPLVYSTTYYVRYVDVNTIELASTLNGSAIDITASGANVTIYAFGTGSLNTISSIDDYYNFTGSGYTYSDLWTSTNTCAGVEVTAGDSNVWKDVTTDASYNASTCSGTPANCTYQDKVSGLWWSKSPGQKDWTNALLYCSSLTYNNQTGWRLPTQKELMNAYEHGMMTASNANWLTSAQMQSYFWSSSTNSTSTTTAWVVYPAFGITGSTTKNNAYYVSCVR